jgi:hypothetical protein
MYIFFTLVRPKLEYVCCVEFHYIYESKQAGTQLAEVRSPLFPHVSYSYACTIDQCFSTFVRLQPGKLFFL